MIEAFAPRRAIAVRGVCCIAVWRARCRCYPCLGLPGRDEFGSLDICCLEILGFLGPNHGKIKLGSSARERASQ